MFVLTVSILLLAIPQSECIRRAKAVLYGDNSPISYGSLIFIQNSAADPVHITGTLSGLNISSAHGFHIHTNPVSDGSPNCTAAGGHFNPYNTLHGPRGTDLKHRHVGDLGNITTNAYGEVTLDMYDWIIQLYNATQSIIDRTVIVHRHRDDGGVGGFEDSHTTGNAGARILCGLVSRSYEWDESNALSIKPTISILLMTMIIIFMKLF